MLYSLTVGQVLGAEKHICRAEAVPTDPGICCHSSPMAGAFADCAIMDLSNQVFCAGMAYVALSRVKQLQNLHLSAFHEEAIEVSVKSLQEINRLRQAYHPDLPKYPVPSEQKPAPQKWKRKISAAVGSNLPSPKKKTGRRKADDSTPQLSRAVQKGKRKIGASAVSNSLSPSSKKTKSTLKRKNNTPQPSPSVVCVSSPQSQTKQKKTMTPSSPDIVCISSPQAQVYKQTLTRAPTRACKRRILSAGQPMPTKRPPSPDIVFLSSPQPHTNQKEKMTPLYSDVVHISSPQAHIHKQKVTHAPTRASKRRILSAGQPMPTKRADFVYSGPKSNIPTRLRYNPVSPDWQRQACQKLRLRFVSENGSVPGGPDVPLTHPVHGRKMNLDGNCLFRALSYIVTRSERQHFQLRSLIVEHVQFLTDHSLADNLRDNLMMLHSVEEHIARTNMALDFVWGTDIEVAIACHLLDVIIAMYCVTQSYYVVRGP